MEGNISTTGSYEGIGKKIHSHNTKDYHCTVGHMCSEEYTRVKVVSKFILGNKEKVLHFFKERRAYLTGVLPGTLISNCTI